MLLLEERSGNIVFIRNSSEEIGRTAANHLLAIGTCRSYAFVHNPSVMQWSIDRCKTFRETLRDNGFWCHELKSPEGLQRLERPIGIFAANDDRGYDVIEFCHAHRIRVPEDAAVLGINNDTLICENCHPQLSSIQPDFEQEGYLAAETLSQMMQPRNPATQQPRNPATPQPRNPLRRRQSRHPPRIDGRALDIRQACPEGRRLHPQACARGDRRTGRSRAPQGLPPARGPPVPGAAAHLDRG